MSIREFRRLPLPDRREKVVAVHDPLTREILETAFLGPRKRSWVQVALMVGGDNTWEGVRKRAMREIAKF